MYRLYLILKQTREQGEFGLLPGDREIVPLYRETPGNNGKVGRSALPKRILLKKYAYIWSYISFLETLATVGRTELARSFLSHPLKGGEAFAIFY